MFDDEEDDQLPEYLEAAADDLDDEDAYDRSRSMLIFDELADADGDDEPEDPEVYK